MTWTSATFTATHAAIYDATISGAKNNDLIGLIDFGSDKTVTAGTFQITWNAAGIITLT